MRYNVKLVWIKNMIKMTICKKKTVDAAPAFVDGVKKKAWAALLFTLDMTVPVAPNSKRILVFTITLTLTFNVETSMMMARVARSIQRHRHKSSNIVRVSVSLLGKSTIYPLPGYELSCPLMGICFVRS
jgi:hypothetical protein